MAPAAHRQPVKAKELGPQASLPFGHGNANPTSSSRISESVPAFGLRLEGPTLKL
jgi:hypothetical protein